MGHALSTGAADDLRRVTDIARSMVTRYGISDPLGGVAYDRDPRTFLTGPGLPLPQREHDYAEQLLPRLTRKFAPLCKRQWIAPSESRARSVKSRAQRPLPPRKGDA